MSDNPIIQQGYLFSKEEYEFLSALLTSCAEAAKKHGDQGAYRNCQRIVVRMKHHVFAGTVPEESYKRHIERIEKAFQTGDESASRAAIMDLCTTLMRMSPDPGRAVSELLMGVMANSLQQQAQAIYATAIKHAEERMLRERAAFEASGYPSGSDVMSYLAELFTAASLRVQDGLPPFPEDDESTSPIH